MLAPTPHLTPRLLVRTATAPKDKASAIREAAQLLIAAGCIDPAYGDSMLRREAVAHTSLGPPRGPPPHPHQGPAPPPPPDPGRGPPRAPAHHGARRGHRRGAQ